MPDRDPHRPPPHPAPAAPPHPAPASARLPWPRRARAAAGSRAARRLALLAVVAAALWIVAAPILALRPFAPQNPALLAQAYWLHRISPTATILACAAAMALAWREWRRSRWFARSALVLAVAAVAATAAIARINHFELMFQPLPHPGYAPAAQASFVTPGDMVLAIEIHGDAVAYPIRQIAYHHVVLDNVGGAPVAVTY